MSYTQCPRCGQKALSIATRCPRCGDPFETHSYPSSVSRSRRVPADVVLLGLGVIYLGFDVLRRGPGVVEEGFSSPPTALAPIPAPQPPPTPTPTPTPPAPQPSQPLPAAAEPAVVPEPRAVDPVAASSQETLYTTIWANVREAPRPMAPVVMVLHPGEPVLVDSISEEWYRVVAEGHKLGYVYSTLVDTAPPAAPN